MQRRSNARGTHAQLHRCIRYVQRRTHLHVCVIIFTCTVRVLPACECVRASMFDCV